MLEVSSQYEEVCRRDVGIFEVVDFWFLFQGLGKIEKVSRNIVGISFCSFDLVVFSDVVYCLLVLVFFCLRVIFVQDVLEREVCDVIQEGRQ